ncbi:MAG: ArsC family (seleno)protein [Gemmataceae bacterium]
MSKSIDWLYHRKGCTSCKKAQGFLEENTVAVKEHADATKDRRGRDEALALAKTATKIVVAKGKKFVTFDMKKAPPDEETLIAHLLGPTGNLRAPTIRAGKTLLVGFNEEAYREILGM